MFWGGLGCFHGPLKTGNCNIVEDLVRIPLRSQIYMLLLFSLAIWVY